MRAVLDPYAFATPQQTARPSARDGNTFSRLIPQQSDRPAPAPSPARASAADTSSDASSTNEASNNSDNQDSSNQDTSNKPNPADPGVQWLNAQIMAFKIKGSGQTTNPDGSVSTNYTTQLYYGTKPPTTAEELAKGLVPPGTGPADPTKGPATDGGTPVVDPNVPTGPATPVVATDPSLKPSDVADPATVAVTPTDPAVPNSTPTDPATVAVTPASPTTVTDTPTNSVTVAVDNPGLVTQVLPKDPIVDPSQTDPTNPDGSVTATADPNSTVPSDSAATTPLGIRSAHAGHESGAHHGNTGQDEGSSDPSPFATSANSQPSVTVPSIDTSLVVPADKQLAPSLGRELVSTAQGMSALERVIQATDQSQAAPAMLKTLNVQLSPADLGNVSVRLSLQGSALDLHLSVDQGKTRDLIERDRHVISDSLSRVGYSVGTLTVEQTSATGNSGMSSAGQSFSSNSSYDGSAGRQSSGSGSGQSSGNGRGSPWNDPEVIPGAAAGRPVRGQGVFI